MTTCAFCLLCLVNTWLLLESIKVDFSDKSLLFLIAECKRSVSNAVSSCFALVLSCCHAFVPVHESQILPGIVSGLKKSRPSFASAYDTQSRVASKEGNFLSRKATSLLFRDARSSAISELHTLRLIPSEMKGMATNELIKALRGISSIPRDFAAGCNDVKFAAE